MSVSSGFYDFPCSKDAVATGGVEIVCTIPSFAKYSLYSLYRKFVYINLPRLTTVTLTLYLTPRTRSNFVAPAYAQLRCTCCAAVAKGEVIAHLTEPPACVAGKSEWCHFRV